MTSEPLSPETQAFRDGMSRLGAAVNLVTTDGAAGRHGITVSAVCSVTDTPPTLLVCINQNAFAHDAFLENGVLCVNVLAPDHQDLSRRFARWTGEERFNPEHWATGSTGAPVLKDAAVAFDCKISDVQPRGTHSVLFCEVQASALAQDASGGLIWFERKFHPLASPL
ncbi:FMN reductase [Thioclava dalianensis]|uniref:FMN reductase n=1 Tax=Thioclava dalianensis TaxID=1185766 RepID=A0A074THI9_9RHOB|nr:flavin reductase [Thioclava dalianensis]KEP71124.1 FMN reductase [Thioclava dalianensis]SFN24409.1 flavin reductase [Thioclava dalianensis]